ncbi:MAG: PcfJ domain-containing protein [Deltaproteobacteria bacterium]|nr:PcfJ domain-containing protein [Deltaproteobacteria bacterium]
MNAPAQVRPARVRAEAQKKKKKDLRELALRRRDEVQAACAAALARGRTPFIDRLGRMLESSEEVHAKDLAPWIPIRNFIEQLEDTKKRAARAFVVAVEARCPGLCMVPVSRDVLGRAVVNMARIADRLLRPVTSWVPVSRSRCRQWDELVAHTCAAFPQPVLLESAFLERFLGDDVRAAAPYVGLGGSWRTAGLPTTITKATAHLLSTSKSRFRRLTTAVRMAQADAAAVTGPHRQALLAACPSWSFDSERDDLWLELFGWLARHPDLDPKHIADVAYAAGGVDLPFTTRGRTTTSMVAWAKEHLRQEKLRDEGRINVGPLPASGVDGGAYVLLRETDACARRFVVVPIQDGKALVDEGLAMKHCVGTYGVAAKEGTTALFSVRVQHFETTPRRLLTVEVALKSRSVQQVRAKCNRSPDDDEKAIVRCWAAERGLTVDQYAL